MEFQFWFNVFTIIIASISIIFTFFNYRLIRRGVIKTDFIGYEKNLLDKEKKQEILEINPFYLYLNNLSKFVLKNIKVKVYFVVKNKIIHSEIYNLDYLNPKEKVSFNISHKNFREKLSEEFEEIEIGDRIFVTPKKNFKFQIKFQIKWDWFFKQKDLYEIEWRSYNDCKFETLKNYLEYNIISYNKRDGHYIYKV